MEAWQLLQGNIPSVIGGEVYSSTTAIAEEPKKSSRNIEVTAALDNLMIVLSLPSILRNLEHPHFVFRNNKFYYKHLPW
jgi:hypothetical protein